MRVSQGCIRLGNGDIEHLFQNVPVDTRVQVIEQPVKTTTEPDGSRWIEVHEPLSRNRPEYESSFIRGEGGDMNRVSEALERHSEMPVNISHG